MLGSHKKANRHSRAKFKRTCANCLISWRACQPIFYCFSRSPARATRRTAAGFRPLRCLVSCGVPVAENLGAGTGFPLFAEIYLQTYTPRARGRVPVRPAAGVPARHVRPQSSIKRISRFRQRGGRSRVAGRKCVLAGAVVCVGCVGKIFNLRGNLQAAIPLFIYHSFPFL